MTTPAPDHHHTSAESTSPALAVAWVNRHEVGTPLVWLHGLGSSSTGGFAEIAQSKALSTVPSLLIDLPGHGDSGKPASWDYGIEHHADAVAHTLSRHLNGPSMVMGHSLGGSVAIALATRHPDLVTHLIAAEPTLDPGRGIVSDRIARQTEDAFVQSGYASLVKATDRLARRGSPEASAWLPDLSKAVPQALHRTSVSLLAYREPTFRQQLTQLTMTVSLITGEHSSHIGASVSAPHLKGYVVSDAAHHLVVDNPTGLAEILAAIHRRRGRI